MLAPFVVCTLYKVCGQIDAPATFPNCVYMYVIALWPAGVIEIVNVDRTIWKVEDPFATG
jgi:hypothetical protein